MSQSEAGVVQAQSPGYGVSKDYTGLHLPTCLLTAFFLHLRGKRDGHEKV